MQGIHPIAWLIWLAAAAAAALLTRNPYYLTLHLLAVGVVYLAFAAHTPVARAWAIFLRFGPFLLGFSVLANGLTVHYGDRILLMLPPTWPLIGGRVTLEAILYGLGNGLSLLALLLVFAVFNSVLAPSALLRWIPAALYQAGVIVTIALTFIPQMVLSAQALERSIQWAESMESRGFAGERLRGRHLIVRGRVLMVIGLAGLGVGAFARAYFLTHQALVHGLLLISSGLLLGTGALLSRAMRRSHYHRWLWRRHDLTLAGASGLVLLIILGLWASAREVLVYYPYPPSSPWPQFQPLVGLALMLLVLPALAARRMPGQTLRQRGEEDNLQTSPHPEPNGVQAR
jgi:energy-coupling factor transport system permease protein